VIDLGHFGGELGGVALRKAAGDDEFFASALLFEGGHLEDGLNRFLFRLADESAGVHDDDVGPIGVVDVDEALLLRGAEHDFAVDAVFDAPEADQVNRFGYIRHASRGI
jgi:hypothetical protein